MVQFFNTTENIEKEMLLKRVILKLKKRCFDVVRYCTYFI